MDELWNYLKEEEFDKVFNYFPKTTEHLSQYPYNRAVEEIGRIRKKKSIELRKTYNTRIISYYLMNGKKIMVIYYCESLYSILGYLESGHLKYSLRRDDNRFRGYRVAINNEDDLD